VLELENMLKINATMAAPIVCPVRRAVPTMPLAPHFYPLAPRRESPVRWGPEKIRNQSHKGPFSK
jgi:hypothetical protein